MKTLYFDESGQTGTKLLDPDQTYFSVASTDINESDARAIIREHFPKYVGTDIKFRKLFRRHSNYQALIEFARTVSYQPERFFCYRVNKKFAILAKMVDWLVEPLVHELGYDWYRNDYGRRWVNMFYYAFQLLGNNNLLDEIISLYSHFSDSPTPTTLAAMQNRYNDIAESGPEILRPFMGFAALGADVFEQNYSLAEFRDPNDIHVTCVMVSVGWWRARHNEDFEVIHDQSTHFFQRQNMWERVTAMSGSDGVVHIGNKSIQFPLRVHSTRPGDSALLAPLQICDLVGGFVTKLKSGTLSIEEQKVLEEMMSAGMGQIGFDCIEPGSEFVDGTPMIADGLDAVDQVIRLTYRK